MRKSSPYICLKMFQRSNVLVKASFYPVAFKDTMTNMLIMELYFLIVHWVIFNINCFKIDYFFTCCI